MAFSILSRMRIVYIATPGIVPQILPCRAFVCRCACNILHSTVFILPMVTITILYNGINRKIHVRYNISVTQGYFDLE